MSRADTLAEDAPPLLGAEDLELWATPQQALVRPGTLSVRCERLVCVGQARVLLQAAVDPSRVRSGNLLFLGLPAAALLSSGRAGYCPRALPAPAEFSVESALIGSARDVRSGSY